MLALIAPLSLLCAAVTLIALAYIDLRIRLLPNPLVLAFALLAGLFHFCTLYQITSPTDMALGGFIGFASLYLLRAIANRYYGHDTLGLGDVKLIGAAGLWLGPEDLFLALAVGAGLGALHGGIDILRARLARTDTGAISTFSVPAGPGLIAGIALAALLKFTPYFTGAHP